MTRALNMKYSPTLTFRRSDARVRQAEMDHLFDSIRGDLK